MRLSTRLTVAMVGLVLLVAAAVELITYRSVETAILPSEFEQAALHVRLLTTELQSYARGARADATAFRSGGNARGLARVSKASTPDTADGAAAARLADMLAARFAIELDAKSDYLRLRIIDIDAGRELVRVGRTANCGAWRTRAFSRTRWRLARTTSTSRRSSSTRKPAPRRASR
jgi:hypothetical protein